MQPAQLEESTSERRRQAPGRVMASFRPIQARPNDRTRRSGRQLYPKRSQAGRVTQCEFGGDDLESDQGIGKLHPQAPC